MIKINYNGGGCVNNSLILKRRYNSLDFIYLKPEDIESLLNRFVSFRIIIS